MEDSPPRNNREDEGRTPTSLTFWGIHIFSKRRFCLLFWWLGEVEKNFLLPDLGSLKQSWWELLITDLVSLTGWRGSGVGTGRKGSKEVWLYSSVKSFKKKTKQTQTKPSSFLSCVCVPSLIPVKIYITDHCSVHLSVRKSKEFF